MGLLFASNSLSQLVSVTAARQKSAANKLLMLEKSLQINKRYRFCHGIQYEVTVAFVHPFSPRNVLECPQDITWQDNSMFHEQSENLWKKYFPSMF